MPTDLAAPESCCPPPIGSIDRRPPLPSLARAWALALLSAVLLPAQAVSDLGEGLALEVVAGGLDAPVALAQSDDERLFIVQREGRVLIFDGQQVRPEPFLDLRSLVLSGGERGLLGLAFHPGYAGNRYFFVNYTGTGGQTVVARYRARADDPDRADPGSGVTLLSIDQPFGNHNGGQLRFGPDGYLYIGMGDGGSGNDPICAGQRDDTLLGKMLRIDVDQSPDLPPHYGIPPDNPFAGPGLPLREIWAKGLRNPWRFSFDRATGDLFIADVGQSAREEVNLQPADSGGGENYGWKRMEGTLCRADVSGCPPGVPPCDSPELTLPILEYPTGADCAIIGGYVYRGAAIPQLQGVYLFGDHCSGRLWAGVPPAGPAEAWARVELGLAAPGLTTFGEDASGEIYLATLGGTLLRLAGPDPDPDPGPDPDPDPDPDPGPAPAPGRLELTASRFTAAEGDGEAIITVRRVDGLTGAVAVDFRTEGGTAVAEFDYLPVAGTLTWADGEGAAKSFAVKLIDDDLPEPDRTVGLVLSNPTGGAGLGPLAAGELVIEDDDLVPGPCQADERVLCLVDARFRVEARWRRADGGAGAGNAIPLTTHSGAFWFFSRDNLELLVKVHDACVPPYQRFWVFAAGLTNVAVNLSVVDTETLEVRRYLNPVGNPFGPLQDTSAFACP